LAFFISIILLFLEHGYLRGKKIVNAASLHAAASAVASGNHQTTLGSLFSGIYGGSSTSSTTFSSTLPASTTNNLSSTSVPPMVGGSSGNNSANSSKSSKTLMDLVIETISKCSDEYDDNVQIQVIKALLTAITSLHCEVSAFFIENSLDADA